MRVRVQQLCDEKGVTVYQLAKDLGLSERTVRGWTGRSMPRQDEYVKKLIQYFDCDFNTLFCYNSEVKGGN